MARPATYLSPDPMSRPSSRRLFLVSNTAWSIANFRLGLARGLREAGYEPIAVAPPDEHVQRILDAGLTYLPVEMNRKGTNPVEDLALTLVLHRLMRQWQPMAYLGWTIKPNVYGGLACRQLGIPSIHNIAGLGFAFSQDSMLNRVARQLYRWGLGRAHHVFFQNTDDHRLMLDAGLIAPGIASRLPGSGVDTTHFPMTQLPQVGNRPLRLLMVARLLREKGVGELAEAVRRLRLRGLPVEVRLLGPFDTGNPAALNPEEIRAWEKEGLLLHLGCTDDVRPHLANCDAVVLPSHYREGLPRTLLEAASMGRPIITTDWVGCRDAVVDGLTGLLCKPRDPEDLARCIERLALMSASERTEMGRRGRERIEREFDEKLIINAYLATITPLG
jgi:glycosyltransferase involved in cell wall biosynthesis